VSRGFTPTHTPHGTVWNKRDPNLPADAVYVGRGQGSILGNPYSHLDSGTLAEHRVASRDEAITAFETYARQRIENDTDFRAAVSALAGRDVACWCAPASCHGEMLLALAAELTGWTSPRPAIESLHLDDM
jgi:hypothetical protein